MTDYIFAGWKKTLNYTQQQHYTCA